MYNDFSIGPQQVHVWRCDLRHIDPQSARRSLSAEESARAYAFVFDRDQVRYAAGRALMRALLSRYTGIKAPHLQLDAREHAKPRLLEHPIRFNASHCADTYVLALCAKREIGIDVEAARIVHDAHQLGGMVFSTSENAELARYEPANASSAFLLGWTRKEAYIKALGVGLGGVDLQAITVGLDLATRTIPIIQGISDRPFEVRSHQGSDEYVATASELQGAEFVYRQVDAGMLAQLDLS